MDDGNILSSMFGIVLKTKDRSFGTCKVYCSNMSP